MATARCGVRADLAVQLRSAHRREHRGWHVRHEYRPHGLDRGARGECCRCACVGSALLRRSRPVAGGDCVDHRHRDDRAGRRGGVLDPDVGRERSWCRTRCGSPSPLRSRSATPDSTDHCPRSRTCRLRAPLGPNSGREGEHLVLGDRSALTERLAASLMVVPGGDPDVGGWFDQWPQSPMVPWTPMAISPSSPSRTAASTGVRASMSPSTDQVGGRFEAFPRDAHLERPDLLHRCVDVPILENRNRLAGVDRSKGIPAQLLGHRVDGIRPTPPRASRGRVRSRRGPIGRPGSPGSRTRPSTPRSPRDPL